MENKAGRQSALKEYQINTCDLLGLGSSCVWCGHFMEKAAFEIDLKGQVKLLRIQMESRV